MSETLALPFVYTNKSISAWLSKFDTADVPFMCHELLKVLSILKEHHKKIDSGALAIVVKRLTPVMAHVSTLLISAIIDHSQASKIAKMSTRTLHYLAFLHAHLAWRVKLKDNKVLHVNYAIQMTGMAFRHCALSYQRPSVGLWECLGDCYELAITHNFLDIAVKKPLIEFQALVTASLALKRLLLFWLANPYRLSQQDILVLFDFCTENCALVHFVQRDMFADHVFCWEYKVITAYQPVDMRPTKIPDGCVAFNTHALVNFEHKQSLNIEAVNLVIAIFDQYRSLLENTKFTLSKSFIFASRFECVVDFFVKHVRQHQVLTINSPAPADLNFFSLAMIQEKDKHEVKVEKVSSTDIWGYQIEDEENEDEELTHKFGAMKLVQTSLPLFYVAETMAVKLLAGDIFVCYDSALKPALGIARRVELKQTGTIKQSVIELCRGRVTLLQQTGQFEQTKSALLLEDGAQKELFMVPAKYETGKVLKFDHVDVVLQRLLEISPYFMRFSVSVRGCMSDIVTV